MSDQISPQSTDVVRSTSLSPDAMKTARKAQFWLRFLGVYFVIQGVSGIIPLVIRLILSVVKWGWDSPTVSTEVLFLPSGLITIIAGLYLIVGGEWVVKTVFLPSPRDDLGGNPSQASGS